MKAKHVESIFAACLDQGSNPCSSTGMYSKKTQSPVKEIFTGLLHYSISAFLPPFLYIAVGLTIGLKNFQKSPMVIHLRC